MRRKVSLSLSGGVILVILLGTVFFLCRGEAQNGGGDETMRLPQPSLDGQMSLERCLAQRRSVRSYAQRPLTLTEISQLMWAAQGITSDSGGRTAPSAGALYPLKLYLVAGSVENLPAGIYLYSPESHSLRRTSEGDRRSQLKAAALNQGAVGSAPASIVIAAVPSVTEARYRDRAMRYIDNEVGCVSQNIYLQCESLGLGTVMIGAFEDESVARVIGTDAAPRMIMPVGALR